MYSTITTIISDALRNEHGHIVQDYDVEIGIAASALNTRLRGALRQLEDDAVAIGLDRSEVRAAFERAGLAEPYAGVTASRPVPALSGGVVAQPAARTTRPVPALPDPQQGAQAAAPQRSLWQRIFGG